VTGRWGRLSNRDDVEVLSVGQVLERSARMLPDKVAMIHEDQRITFKETNERADAMAAALQSLGVTKGDRVAVSLQNIPEIAYTFFGITKLGAITAWANPAYREEEVEFILRNSGAKVAIMHRELKGFDYLRMLGGMRSRLPDLQHVIMIDPRPDDGVIDYRRFLEKHAGAAFYKPPIDIKKDYALFYNTGGTTGIPKAAAHTHYTAIMRATVTIDDLELTADDVTLALMPMFHPFGGAASLVLPIATLGTIVLMPEYNAEKSLQLIQEHKVTIHHCAPAHILMCTKLPNFKEYDVSSLRTGLAAGFRWPPEVFVRAYEEMNLDLVHIWGMAEIGGMALGCAPNRDGRERRNIYMGRPYEGEAMVVDPDTRKPVPPGEPGELVFRGEIFKEYWNNPVETAKAFDSEGWFYTGDMVTQNEEGYIKMVGRYKEQINRGGLKIEPGELENLLIKHPKVKEVCVIATPNPVLGESICACIVPMGEDRPTLKELREYLQDKVAQYKLPEELAIFESFPRLAGGVKYKKFGEGSIQEMATKDETREKLRK